MIQLLRGSENFARLSVCRPVLVVLVGLLLVTGPAAASWWWPSQGTWLEADHITPDDAHEGGHLGNPSHWGVSFGSAVALDGDTLAVGTQFDSFQDGWETASGDGGDWIYIFERSADGTWSQTSKLIPNDAHEGDTFGYSLDLDAEAGTIVAGNPVAEKVYIFEKSETGEWAQSAAFKPPADATGPEELFGYTVAVNGDTVAAGWSPSVYLYEKAGSEWTEAGTIPGGILVALEGETLVTSIWQPDTGLNKFALYSEEGQTWTEVARLDPSAPFESENTVGCTVAIDEDERTVVIGACIDRRLYGIPTEQRVEVGESAGVAVSAGAVGSVWIYELVGDEWTLTADLPNPDPAPNGDRFGNSVAVSGSRVLVGAPFDDYNGARDGAGAVYVYEGTEEGWLLTAKLRNHDNGPYGGGDLFGRAVAISGSTAVAGAPFDDQRRDGTPWPVDDDGDTPGCIHREFVWGCDEGEDAGSVYVFESITSSLDRSLD